MKINCYQNFKKRSNETLQPTGTGTEMDVVLKKATSITNPTFILSGFDPTMNYIAVPSWSRKYFVVDYQKGNNDLYEVQCEEDYAGTWKDDIATYNCYVERSASNYDNKIHDGAISSKEDIVHTASASTICGFGNLGVILRVMGREDNGGIGTYYTTLINMSKWFGNIFGDIDTDPTFADVKNLVVIQSTNPSQYVTGVYTTPIGAATYGEHCTPTTLYMGGHKTDITIDKIITHTVTIGQFTLAKPVGIYSDFRKYDPNYSNYYLYIPTVGEVKIAGDLIDTELSLDISADLLSGDLFFSLMSDGDMVATYSSNCYSSLGVGGTHPFGGVFAGAMNTITSLATHNAIGVINAVHGAMQETSSVLSTQGGTGCISLHKEAILTVTQKASADIPQTVAGRPCCKNLTLGNLTGYIKCGNASIDIAGTKTEKDAVNNLLNSGFYFT